MENIFIELVRRNVPFAVGVEYNTLISAKNNVLGQKYFILICKSDQQKVNGLGFKDESRLYILERDLSDNETVEFKNSLTLFNEVVNDNSGRLYELKDHSFKAYYVPFRRDYETRMVIGRMIKTENELNKKINNMKKEIERLKSSKILTT